MRGRTTRHGRIERNRRLNARASLRDVALVYAAMALVPVLLWLLTNPALAAGLALLVGLVALLMRRGRRIVRSSCGHGERPEREFSYSAFRSITRTSV